MFAMISSFVCDYCHFGVDKCFRTNYIEPVWRGFSRLQLWHCSTTVAEPGEAPNVLLLQLLFFLVHFWRSQSLFLSCYSNKTVLHSVSGVGARAPRAAPNAALEKGEYTLGY